MKKDNICILLGAGASAEQFLPDWQELVEGVTTYYNINLNIDKDNLIESIGIIEDNQLSDIQNKLLDANISCEASEYRSWARQKIALATKAVLKKNLLNISIKKIKERMNLMKKIVDSVYSRVEAGLITTIITYNFDDYFEFAYKCLLQKKGELTKYNEHVSVYTIGDEEQHLPSGTMEKPINIYHVHGCIPIFDELFGYKLYGLDKEQYKLLQKEHYNKCLECGIIFSGNDYNTLIDDSIVGWTNMIQYISYSQLPVIIVGFSLTDANFRTLIRRMKKSNDIMNQTIVFLGYPNGDDSKKQKAEASSKTVEYLLKDICSSCDPQCEIKEFVKELPKSVHQYINTFLS